MSTLWRNSLLVAQKAISLTLSWSVSKISLDKSVLIPLFKVFL